MRHAIALFLFFVPVLASAQTIEITPLEPIPQIQDPEPRMPRVSQAPGAVVRVLDRVSGEVRDLELDNGEDARIGRLEVSLAECRYPTADPSSDAYAHLTVRDQDAAEPPVFAGWMIASSPALNALDHVRYDVWVLRCANTAGEGVSGAVKSP